MAPGVASVPGVMGAGVSMGLVPIGAAPPWAGAVTAASAGTSRTVTVRCEPYEPPQLPPLEPQLPELPPLEPQLPELPPHELYETRTRYPPLEPQLPELPPLEPQLPELPPHEP